MSIRASLTLALAAVTLVAPAALADAPATLALRPIAKPTPTPGPGGQRTTPAHPSVAGTAYDATAEQAIRQARSGLDQYRDLETDYRRARTPQDRAALQGHMEQATANALQAIATTVADTRRDDPPTRVRIYQIARDALGSGNRSGDPAERIRYNVNALRAIAVMQP